MIGTRSIISSFPQLLPKTSTTSLYMATTTNEVLENMSDVVEQTTEALENLSHAVEQNQINPAPEMPNHGGMESQPFFSEEEVRNALETSASTGKFWLDWERLKSILSYHLNQVLSEYPEAKMTSDQQASLLGETFQELVKRLDNALHSFNDGPPFTLQRLCEILLSPRSIYSKLSKLSLALEKNLLVSSTLTISHGPYPLATPKNSNTSCEGNGNGLPQMNSVQENGVEAGDGDVVMADAQEATEGGGSEDITNPPTHS